MGSDRKICVGMIAGSHGVRGLIRLRSFTEDPGTIAEFKSLTDESGEKTFTVEIKSAAKDFYIASIDGPQNKEEADALRGLKLYVSRRALPKPGKNKYYEADLIGLLVKDKAGKEFGMVRGIYDYGAGPFFEIGKSKADSFMLPFTDTFVPVLDVKAGFVTIDPPEGWLETQKPKPKAEKPAKVRV